VNFHKSFLAGRRLILIEEPEFKDLLLRSLTKSDLAALLGAGFVKD